MRKSPFDVFSYWHTRASTSGASASEGTRRSSHRRAVSTLASSMTRTFLVVQSGALSPTENAAIGRFLVHREREMARLRRSIGTPWRGVAGLRFRRSLGRVVAGL